MHEPHLTLTLHLGLHQVLGNEPSTGMKTVTVFMRVILTAAGASILKFSFHIRLASVNLRTQ